MPSASSRKVSLGWSIKSAASRAFPGGNRRLAPQPDEAAARRPHAHACAGVTGGILWANLHLLFWLSLFPFVTGWMGENHFAALPSALYGVVLLAAAIAYWILQQTLSPAVYVCGIVRTYVSPWIAQALYVAVALVWLVPDRRIETWLRGSHAAR